MAVKYLVGESDFGNIRTGGILYVDKTDLVYQLVETGKYYFLSRPRRFGKSLLLSTLEAYFQGRKELFAGLAIEKLEPKWERYPVLKIDFGARNYIDEDSLTRQLQDMLEVWEARYNLKVRDAENYEGRLARIIRTAHAATERQVVVLIDEYDKPVLDMMKAPAQQEKNREMLRSFYSTLKSSMQHLRFVFITGITKFVKISIFSGFNNLFDISIMPAYACICGISESELRGPLSERVKLLAEVKGYTLEEMYAELKKLYDGYKFTKRSQERLYNPFSLLAALLSGELEHYWFETGTPEFLYQSIMQHQFKLANLEHCTMPEGALAEVSAQRVQLVPLLYQTGYLTIESYDEAARLFHLRLPNQEVRTAFYDGLAQYFFLTDGSGENSIPMMLERMVAGDLEQLFNKIYSFLAGFSYEIPKDATEYQFQFAMELIFKGMGELTRAEYHTSSGRIDTVVETPQYVYIFEFKRDRPAAEAMAQIEEKGYAAPFAADCREVIKLGVSFSSSTRTLAECIIRREGQEDVVLVAQGGTMERR